VRQKGGNGRECAHRENVWREVGIDLLILNIGTKWR